MVFSYQSCLRGELTRPNLFFVSMKIQTDRHATNSPPILSNHNSVPKLPSNSTSAPKFSIQVTREPKSCLFAINCVELIMKYVTDLERFGQVLNKLQYYKCRSIRLTLMTGMILPLLRNQ
jgi:hypothetical protein